MPNPGPAPATIDIGGTIVHIDTRHREGDGTLEHNRTSSFFCDIDGREIGVVWRLNRGEIPHYAMPHNEHVHDYAEHIWFARSPLGSALAKRIGRDSLVTGPYPSIVEAVTALLEAA